MQDTPSPASGEVTGAAAATVTGRSNLRLPPPPRWRGHVSYCDVTGAATATVTGSASHCNVTHDTAVDICNRQQATGNRKRYKKPAEQYVKLVCESRSRRVQL
jgi:hypothetical protein